MATHRNSRSPLVINIARLGRRPGSMMTSTRRCQPRRASAWTWRRSPRAHRCDLDLRIESVSEGVLVTGTVSAPTTGECARCLTPVHRGRGDRPHRAVRLSGQRHRGDHRSRRGRTRRQRHHRPRTADHRRRRPGAAVLAGVRTGLPGAVPGLRRPAGDGRTGPWSREDRPALGEALRQCWRPTTSDG